MPAFSSLALDHVQKRISATETIKNDMHNGPKISSGDRRTFNPAQITSTHNTTEHQIFAACTSH